MPESQTFRRGDKKVLERLVLLIILPDKITSEKRIIPEKYRRIYCVEQVQPE
jgi:hypothetical protein